MNEFDDGYLDDYPEDDYEDVDESSELIFINDIDELNTWILHAASVNADLVLAGFGPENPEKMIFWEMGMMAPYDPTADYEFISKEELEIMTSEYITYIEDEPCMSSDDAMKCSEAIAIRIISSTYEMAAKRGLVEPVVTPEGEFTYIAKGSDI